MMEAYKLHALLHGGGGCRHGDSGRGEKLGLGFHIGRW